jgi:hypothetical protein
MRFLTICLALLLAIPTIASADPFQDLDFEQATRAGAPANYEPTDAFEPISAAAALPGWTVVEDSTVCNAIWGQPVALDETSVALVSSNAIQGNYDVMLSSYINAPQGYFHTASISQTGDIPAGTQSIQFAIRSPTVAGGLAPVPFVSVAGTPINVFELSNAGGIQQWGGNIYAFAGTTSNIDFTSAGNAADGFPGDEDYYELDTISFSTQPVPEPASIGLLAIIGCSLLCRRTTRT